MRLLARIALGLVLVLTACGDSDGASAPAATEPETVETTTVEPVTTPEPTSAATPEPTPMPEPTPLPPLRAESPSQVAAVVLDVINGDRELTPAQYDTMFEASFRDQVPYAGFLQVSEQLAPSGPWSLQDTLVETSQQASYLIEDSSGEQFTLDVVLGDNEVTGLLLQPWSAPPEGVDEAIAALDATGETAYLAAEVMPDGTCRSVVDSGADQIMPLGSVFKLLVLGALVDSIEAGTISWDDPVTISDALDSYPSGTTQDVPAGETRTVRELAEVMISISDNTATDHLLFLVGRTAVEDAQADWGVTDPDLNRPFLSTRELFQIKLDAALSERYLAAATDERRVILDELATQPLTALEDLDPTSFSQPTEITTLEWFATPADVCRVLGRLAQNDEALRILEANPGAPSDRWERVGFKGGSEPGVLAAAWVMSDADDRLWAFTGAVWNEEQAFPQDAAFAAFVVLRDGLDYGD